MKRTLLISGAIVVLLLIVAGIALLFMQHNATGTVPNNSTNSGNPFPVSGTSSQNNSGASNSGTYSVENVMGGTITAKDFIHNGTTVVDQNNKDDYYLAGAPQYCTSTSCPSGPSTDYYITYRQSSKAFVVGLTNEPLGQSRLEAEKSLMSALGISQTQMCDLNYFVLTTSAVNANYAGKNLGFSFCPGATQLP